MLRFETGLQVDEFMKREGVPFPYEVEDFEADIETLTRAGMLSAR